MDWKTGKNTKDNARTHAKKIRQQTSCRQEKGDKDIRHKEEGIKRQEAGLQNIDRRQNKKEQQCRREYVKLLLSKNHRKAVLTCTEIGQ